MDTYVWIVIAVLLALLYGFYPTVREWLWGEVDQKTERDLTFYFTVASSYATENSNGTFTYDTRQPARVPKELFAGLHYKQEKLIQQAQLLGERIQSAIPGADIRVLEQLGNTLPLFSQACRVEGSMKLFQTKKLMSPIAKGMATLGVSKVEHPDLYHEQIQWESQLWLWSSTLEVVFWFYREKGET